MFWRTKKLTYEETEDYVIKTIREFLDGTGGTRDLDNFISFPTGYPEWDALQDFCPALSNDYPPTANGGWCNEDGIRAQRHKLDQLERNHRLRQMGATYSSTLFRRLNVPQLTD